MGQYNIPVEELADEIYDLLYDLEGDYKLKDLIEACKEADKRLNWNNRI